MPEWRDTAAEMRTGRRRSPPVFRTVEEKLEHVAAGHGIVMPPLSTAVFYTRPGVAYSHVSDISPNQVCLAWDATRFDLKYGMPGVTHDQLMTNIDLYGRQVIPRVRELLTTRAEVRAPEAGASRGLRRQR